MPGLEIRSPKKQDEEDPGQSVPGISGSLSHIPPMNALQILRETIRILRQEGAIFTLILIFLICPVSAVLLSDVLVSKPLMLALSRRLMLAGSASGLPLTLFVRQACHFIADTLLSSISCFPFLLSFLLLARSSVAYSVACSYAVKILLLSEFISFLRSKWKHVVSTYLWSCATIFACMAVFFVILSLVCSFFSLLGYPSGVIIYPAFLVILGFSIAYAHTVIVCNLAGVISVLENRSGVEALLRSMRLMRGQTHAGLMIFLGSTIGLAFVEGLFEHRVKTLSYGDGSSRIWEAPLLVLMYSFVVLVDSMMSAVFYFTCRSSSIQKISIVEDHPGGGMVNAC